MYIWAQEELRERRILQRLAYVFFFSHLSFTGSLIHLLNILICANFFECRWRFAVPSGWAPRPRWQWNFLG